jgi:hypothetical protein
MVFTVLGAGRWCFIEWRPVSERAEADRLRLIRGILGNGDGVRAASKRKGRRTREEKKARTRTLHTHVQDPRSAVFNCGFKQAIQHDSIYRGIYCTYFFP